MEEEGTLQECPLTRPVSPRVEPGLSEQYSSLRSHKKNACHYPQKVRGHRPQADPVQPSHCVFQTEF